MSAVFGSRPPDLPEEPPGTELVARDRDVETVRRRWEIRAAQWRALALARHLFGEETRAHLSGASDEPARGPFRALLHLEVPFQDLDVHREREAAFTHWASRDPVLTRVHLIYVFTPGAVVS